MMPVTVMQLSRTHTSMIACYSAWCGVQVVEHVAGYLGLDATLVRERNFMYPKDLPAHPYAPPTLQPKSQAHTQDVATAPTKKDDQNCNGKAENLYAHIEAKGKSDDDKGQKQGGPTLSKGHTTPDVVCGRFQLKEPGSNASQESVTSSGR